MQNYCKTIGALAAASALVAGNASAEVEYEIHTGYTNEYLFRGQDFGDDLAEVGADVSTEWNGLGLSAGAWFASFSNNTPAAPAGDVRFDELDIYGEVSKDLGFATAAVGYIWYLQDANLFDDAQEAYVSLSRQFVGVDFSLAYYWDVESDNDGYSQLKASKGFEISPCLTLNTGAALGYFVEEGDLAHLTTKVSLDWAFTETATLSPFVSNSWGLAETRNYTSRNEFVAGSLLSVSF